MPTKSNPEPPKRRGRKATGRTVQNYTVTMSSAQKELFDSLGASRWLQDTLDDLAKTATEPLIV